MEFNETKQNRIIYASALQISNVYSNAYLKNTGKIKTNKNYIIKVYLLLFFSLLIGYYLYKFELPLFAEKCHSYLLIKLNDLPSVYILGVGISFIIVATLVILSRQTTPKIFRTLQKFIYGKKSINVFDFADPHLLGSNYILLTYLSADDKTKHKDEITQIVRNNPHKKVIVYVLPYRVPYIVRFDEYVFCFAVKDGKMQLLGIVQDNKDHTMSAILAQTHKMGPLMKGEEIEKNYEIMN